MSIISRRRTTRSSMVKPPKVSAASRPSDCNHIPLNRPSGVGQIDARDPLILAIGLPLHKSGPFEPLEHLCHGRGGHFQPRRQLALGQAFLLVQHIEHRRLAAIDPDRIEEALRPHIVQPADLAQQEIERFEFCSLV